jgi:hypothetical protein
MIITTDYWPALAGLESVLDGLVVLGVPAGLVVGEAAPVVEGLVFMAGSVACEPLLLTWASPELAALRLLHASIQRQRFTARIIPRRDPSVLSSSLGTTPQ